MKTKMRALAVAVMVLIGTLGFAAPAQAHDDPWTTHSHCNSYGCYKMCSAWDEWFNGCHDGYYIVYNPIRWGYW
jgi:hypothetical protein